ncbi:alanine racemase [Candidatus Bathyarchaeota archaeon]|nr:alanine racemase [Candidatus Bathyarchaeota archaeon]
MIPDSLVIRPVWAEVNLDRLAHNIREVRRVTPGSAEIMAAVKADGYGHGAVESAKAFLGDGADRLATATLGEAMELRRGGVEAPILVLGYVPEYLYPRLLEYGVSAAVYQVEHAEALSRVAVETGRETVVHVKVDTGMGRLGFKAEEAVKSIAVISGLPGVRVEGVFTHFAVSDEADKSYTRDQFRRFMKVVDRLEARGVEVPLRHVSNSAAIIDLPEYSLDMVRPGIMLYGYYPSPDVDHSRVDLRPAMAFKAKVSHVKTVPAGTGLSYGLTYHTGRETVVATLPVGYADGYRRGLSNRGEVSIRGRRAPIVGRVCMDQCMVDVTDVPGVEVGDVATLFGGSGAAPSVEEVAGWLGTIVHEVTCGVSRRVPRVYLRDGKPVSIKDGLC